MRQRLYKRGIAYVLIAIFTVVSAGCGKRKADFDEYGVNTESAEQKHTETSSERKSDDSASAVRADGKLSDQLGGTEFKYAQDFTLGGNSAGINVEFTVTDTEKIPTYKASEITEKDVHEDEMVKKVFGDTGEALDKEERSYLSVDQGDSPHIIDVCTDILYFNNGEINSELEKCKSWIDEDDYYLHTYEGIHNGITYQFMVSYSKKTNEKVIALYPKSFGDISGNPDMNLMGYTDSSGMFYSYDMSQENMTSYDTKTVMADRPNKCTLSEEEIVDSIVDSMHDDFFLNIPGSEMIFSTNMFSGYEMTGQMAEGKSEILYYNEDALSDSTLPGAVMDGYCVSFYNTLGKQKVFSTKLSPHMNVNAVSRSKFLINNSGLVGFSVWSQYNFDEELMDNVKIMNFDDAMKKFEEEMIKNIDVSQADITSSKVEFNWINLGYYPIEDGNGGYNLIPVWIGVVENAGSIKIQGIINAIDGTFITAFYS